MFNENLDIIPNRGQFLSVNIIKLLENQTDLLIKYIKINYEYIKGIFNLPLSKDEKR